MWMKSAGMSGRTITARIELVEMMSRRMNVEPVSAGWKTLAVFLADDRFSAGTRQTYLGHLRAWFHWLILTDQRLDDPTLKLHKGKPVRRKPRPVTVAQLGDILETRMHTRTRAMVLLGAYEGLRAHEIAKFRADDFDGDRLRVMGKGGYYDELPIHPLVEEIAERMPDAGLWFPSYTKDGPLLPNSVSTIVGQVMRRAGVRRTAHALRHFYGTQCLKASGGNIVVTQQLMRHANIASTAGYTDVEESERRATVLALPVPVRLRVVA